MPAAPLRERRVSNRSRPKGAGERGRPRAPRSISAPTSKLSAVRKVGSTGPVAGAVALLLAALMLAATLATGGRLRQTEAAAQRLGDRAVGLWLGAETLIQGGFGGIGLNVAAVHLQGASRNSQEEILRAASIRLGQSLVDLDLNAVRARVEKVGWVERARVIRLFPDTVVIAVTERPLMAVWQHEGRSDVVASNGAVATGVNPVEFRGLPLIIGPGANEDAVKVLSEVAGRPRLAARISAIRKVDRRRWDLILKNGCVILLAASDEASSLARLDRLDRDSRILDLALARIDLRDSALTVVRPRVASPPVVSHGV